MRFIVDAQLPRRMTRLLHQSGQDALHTLDLPEANRTSDTAILQRAARESRVVITKDSDFVDSFLLDRKPEKLLLISTGNITNAELEAIFMPNLDAIIAALTNNNFVELTRTALIIRP